MSLFSAISTSTQSLRNVESQIGVTSDNIGNAQNPNYVRREVNTVQTGGGANVTDVSRAVNTALQQATLTQSAASSGAGTLNQIYTQLEQLTGSATGTPSLSAASQALVTAFQNYATTPESTAAQQGAVQAANNLVSTVHSLSSGLESFAAQVQGQAQTDVKTLNSDLTTIAQLNTQIASNQAAGQSTADLADQRDAALNDVATLLPVQTRQNTDGTVSLATPDGISLVSGGTATQFTYTAYTPGAGGVAGTNAKISVSGDPSATSLNAAFSTGKIGTELNALRVDDAGAASSDPSTAPIEKMRRQLDAFVDQFYSSNAATPTAIQTAYNGAATQTGELASNLFLIPNQSGGGNPQPAGNDRQNFELNPAITSGTSTLKVAAATPVIQALTSNSTTALSAGDVTNFTGTISSLADSIAAAQSGRASAAKANADQQSQTLASVQSSYSSATGVSMDQELAHLVVLQNAYSASAKVISTAATMFQTLSSLLS